MKVVSILALAVTWLLVFADASAQRVRLDDNLSPQQMFSLDLAWQPHQVSQAINAMLNESAAALPPLTGFIPAVEIRLNTSAYVGQRVRIFLVLPPTIVADPSAGSLQLTWEVSGDFLPGSVLVGQEALLFDGVLESPVTSGTFDFVLLVESDGIPDSFSIEPYYELEVSS